MKKRDAVELFGNQSALARALGLTRSAVSAWPDDLDPARVDRVVGAAVRLGKPIPRAFGEKLLAAEPR